MKSSSIAIKANKGRLTGINPIQVIPVSTFVAGAPRVVEGTITREEYLRRNARNAAL